jgi:hypothetical protein
MSFPGASASRVGPPRPSRSAAARASPYPHDLAPGRSAAGGGWLHRRLPGATWLRPVYHPAACADYRRPLQGRPPGLGRAAPGLSASAAGVVDDGAAQTATSLVGAPRAGWSVAWLLHAIDTTPAGEARTWTSDVRAPAGWLRFRLSAWLDEQGQPMPRDRAHHEPGRTDGRPMPMPAAEAPTRHTVREQLSVRADRIAVTTAIRAVLDGRQPQRCYAHCRLNPTALEGCRSGRSHFSTVRRGHHRCGARAGPDAGLMNSHRGLLSWVQGG